MNNENNAPKGLDALAEMPRGAMASSKGVELAPASRDQVLAALDRIAVGAGLPSYTDLQAFVTKCEQKYQTENHVAAIMDKACAMVTAASHPDGNEYDRAYNALEREVRVTLAAVGS